MTATATPISSRPAVAGILRRVGIGLAASAAVLTLGAGQASAQTIGAAPSRPSVAKPIECQQLFGKTYICKVTLFGEEKEYVCVLDKGCTEGK